MKAITYLAVGAIALSFATAAAVSALAQEPAEALDTSQYYLDADQTPGTWRYLPEMEEKLALFGDDPRQPVFLIRCAAGEGMAIGRVTDSAQEHARVLSVTTETMTRRLEAVPVPSRPQILAASIDANDPLLDAMAITKGRFAIEVEGLDTLYLPAWVEVSRVIEDCR